jgi:hypothetical protein
MTNGRRRQRGGLNSSFGATSDDFVEVLLNIRSASSKRDGLAFGKRAVAEIETKRLFRDT